VFLVNSRLGLFTAPTLRWDPFSRSYGVILPSSLARVLSNALVSSTHLPVSVCGTDVQMTPYEDFLVSVESPKFTFLQACPSRLSLHVKRIFLLYSLNAWTWTITRLEVSSCVPPSVKRHSDSTGILTSCPSTTPFGLALGPTNPGRMSLPQETLGLRRPDFSSEFALLMPT
jgi:hypothetical protein